MENKLFPYSYLFPGSEKNHPRLFRYTCGNNRLFFYAEINYLDLSDLAGFFFIIPSLLILFLTFFLISQKTELLMFVDYLNGMKMNNSKIDSMPPILAYIEEYADQNVLDATWRDQEDPVG